VYQLVKPSFKASEFRSHLGQESENGSSCVMQAICRSLSLSFYLTCFLFYLTVFFKAVLTQTSMGNRWHL